MKQDLTEPGGAPAWVPFDAYITLTVVVKGGTCTATVAHAGKTYSAQNGAWKTIDPTRNYFKAGNYIQSNVTNYGEAPGDFSRLVLQSVSVTHQ